MHNIIAAEQRSRWTVREYVLRAFRHAARQHSRSMTQWWKNVVSTLPLPCELQWEISSWLAVSSELTIAQRRSFARGNLKSPVCVSAVDFPRHPMIMSLRAMDSLSTVRQMKKHSLSSACSVGCDLKEWMSMRARYFSTCARGAV
jgi:hypothetical protein